MSVQNMEQQRARMDAHLADIRVDGPVDWSKAPENAKASVYNREKDFHIFVSRSVKRSGCCIKVTDCNGKSLHLIGSKFETIPRNILSVSK